MGTRSLARRAPTTRYSTPSLTQALTALSRSTLGSTQTQMRTVSLSTCAHPMETPRGSSAPTEPFSTSSTLYVTGGTTLTVPRSQTSTTSMSSSTRNRPSPTARLSSARMTRTAWSSSPSSPRWSASPANKFGPVQFYSSSLHQLFKANILQYYS